MAKYPLGPLLSAREFREELAERETARARTAMEEAKAAAAAAREELARYREWRPGEEKRLFEFLRGRDVTQTELDKHLQDIQLLRDAELRREEEVKAAD
jgi:type III secretion protein O